MALRALASRRRHARAVKAVGRFPLVKSRRPHGLDRPLVVTLTSYPPRFPHLGKTLRSLLDQTVAPDSVVLWLAHADIDALPRDVRALEAYGLEIRGCDDLRSYKKLVPALKEDPDRYFVTADDDVYYPQDWLEGLVEAAREHPSQVVAWRAHIASLDEDGNFRPYREWLLATDRTFLDDPSKRLFPTGVGGILYPPGCFAEDIVQEDLFLSLAPHGDDIWFFWQARAKGTDYRRVPAWFDIVEWPSTQSVALYANNMMGDGNDRQIAAMAAHYGPVP
jgi:hypothetical protein